jgi:arylsulfatase A-like enzyme
MNAYVRASNGAEVFTWPDGGTTKLRGEKNTQYEGGYRVPCIIRWPGVIKPGTVINDIGSHEDMMETLLAAAGDTTAKEDLLKGKQYGDKTFKVHLDGTTCCRRSRARANGRGTISSTGLMTAASRRYATTTGS